MRKDKDPIHRFKCDLCKRNAYSKVDFYYTVCEKCDEQLYIREKEREDKKTSHRNCRDCKKPLHPSRYLRCYECVPSLEKEDDNEFMFFYLD